ncbi:uncharacterized protein [Apostichopus japonicus]|uniref:uncharacterized protein n=1 Tax=Stichopus japonicus TaxID=307972 RepID=UPI003AB54A7E
MKTQAAVFLRVLILLIVFLQYTARSTWTKDLYHARYDGISIFFVVDAEVVQAKLDEYFKNNPGVPTLYISADPVFPGLESGEHVVNIEFGVDETFEFSTMFQYAGTLLIFLPFLSASPDGPADYTLKLGEFYPESLQDITKLEELTIDGNILIRDQGQELRFSFNDETPCVSSPTKALHVKDDEVMKSTIFGYDELVRLYECDEQIPKTDLLVEHCERFERILPEVRDAEPNVCVFTTITKLHSCQATVQVLSITQGIRDVMLLGEGQITIIGAERFRGLFNAGLKYPCVEM